MRSLKEVIEPGHWKRLTKTQVINYVIVRLMLSGVDEREELQADGDPGPFLEGVIQENMVDWPVMSGGGSSVPGPRIYTLYLVLDIATEVGYDGDDLLGFISYLRELPDDGPVGAEATDERE